MDDKALELLKKECEIHKLSRQKENLKQHCFSNILLCMFWVFLYSINILPKYNGALLVVLSILVVLEMISLICSIIIIKKDYK